MSHAIRLNPDPRRAQETAVADIAKETATSTDIVKGLYEEAVAILNAQAKITQFVTLLAAKQVRQQLRSLGVAH